ncbi:MAG: PQQ-binding-like beta-propeller repeat protein [Opitutales bacterium]
MNIDSFLMPVMKAKLIPLIAATLSQSLSLAADWPQWRGPLRDGSSSSSVPLADSWPEDGPKLLWESEIVPSGDDGGFGSPVVADGQVYLSLVWHRDVPTDTRVVDDLAMRKIGVRRVNLPAELIAKMEEARISISSRMRGSNLDDWSKQWVEENFDAKQGLLYGDYVISRFRKGKLAFPIEATQKLLSIRNKVIPDESEFLAWIDEQGFDEETRKRVVEGVPATKKMADDVVVSIDLENGATRWKASLEGIPSGRTSSATPCVADGRIFSVGSNRMFCIDVKSGKVLWDVPINSKGGSSSVLVEDGKVIALVGRLTAFDAATGKILWVNKDLGGNRASPITWKPGRRKMVVCNSSRSLVGVDLASGETVWEAPAGGNSTPVASGDRVVVHAKDEKVGLAAYRWTGEGVELAWKVPKLTRRADASPLVKDGQVYLFGADMRACHDLETGNKRWKEIGKHDISSPILAGGHILAYEIKGSFLHMVKADPAQAVTLGRAKIQALRCSSPVIAGDKLIVRMADRVACYYLGK